MSVTLTDSPGALETNAEALQSVRRWLTLRRDVLVTGDVGSGRSTVLAELLAGTGQRSRSRLLLRAAGDAPLSAFTTHPSFVASQVGSTVGEVAAWLVAELGSRTGLLLIDDLDELDPVSAAVVARVLRATDAGLVATARSGEVRLLPPLIGHVMAERAPAVERLANLGFHGVYRLISSELGGVVDAPLAAAVYARSGGNPRVALAVTTAARHARLIDLEDGVWRKVGSLDHVPGDAVLNALLGRVTPEEDRALSLLAWLGPVQEEVAERVVGEVTLARLRTEGRVIEHPDGAADGALIAVGPPALGTALRQRMGAADHYEFARHVTSRCGAEVRLPPAPGRPVHRVPGGAGAGGRDLYEWSAQMADLALTEATVRADEWREQWVRTGSVEDANRYLRHLMHRADPSALAEVFTDTAISGVESDAELVEFCLQRSRWAHWAGVTDGDLSAMPGQDDPRVRSAAQAILGARDVVFGGDDRGDLTGLVRSSIPWVAAWQRVVIAGALMDAGRPDLALGHTDHEDLAGHPDAVHASRGLRVLCLLLDETTESERLARDLLSDSCRTRDLVGIRVYASVLAEVLAFVGRSAEAWRVLNTELALGVPGPAGRAFHRRGLTFGVLAQAASGADDLVEVLARELDAGQPTSGLLCPCRAVAHAAWERVGGDRLAGARMIEEEAARESGLGHLTCEVLSWLAHPAIDSPAMRHRLEAALGAARLPVFQPYLDLALALERGDAAAVQAAHARVSPAISRRLSVLGHRALREVPTATVVPPSDLHHDDQIGELSPREREIALLAQQGLTNREIARQLILSVRTVENHMSAVLRKLRVPSRASLQRWGFPD